MANVNSQEGRKPVDQTPVQSVISKQLTALWEVPDELRYVVANLEAEAEAEGCGLAGVLIALGKHLNDAARAIEVDELE